MQANLSAPSCIEADGTFNNCSGEDIKDNDLYQWKKKLLGMHTISDTGSNSGLIGADGCIEVASSGVSTIILSWSSTLKSKDAAGDLDTSSLAYQCGQANAFRHQLRVQIYTGKSL
jgi:type IV pilus assembly protein PilV